MRKLVLSLISAAALTAAVSLTGAQARSDGAAIQPSAYHCYGDPYGEAGVYYNFYTNSDSVEDRYDTVPGVTCTGD